MELDWSAIAGLGGVVIGGFIQAFVTQRQGQKDFIRNARQRDYQNFVENIAALAKAPPGSDLRRDCEARLIGSKGKILLSGSSAVVSALERFSRHPTIGTEAGYNDFGLLVASMRADVGSDAFANAVPQIKSIMFEQAKQL